MFIKKNCIKINKYLYIDIGDLDVKKNYKFNCNF